MIKILQYLEFRTIELPVITSPYKPLNFKHKNIKNIIFLLCQAGQSTAILICFRRKIFFKSTSSRLQIRVIFSYSSVWPSAAFLLCSVPNNVSAWGGETITKIVCPWQAESETTSVITYVKSLSLAPDTAASRVVLQCVRIKGKYCLSLGFWRNVSTY